MSTLSLPLLLVGNSGKVFECPTETTGLGGTRLSPLPRDDIVVPRRAASSRRRRITVSSMLSVAVIWKTKLSVSGTSTRRPSRSSIPRDRRVARTGAVTLIERFSSALNLEFHLHTLFVDGLYAFEDEWPRLCERLTVAFSTNRTRLGKWGDSEDVVP